MGFGQQGKQAPPTNYTAKRYVLANCGGTTGNMLCTFSVIWTNDSTSTTLPTINSFSFIPTPTYTVPNTDLVENLYPEPYIYSLTFSSNPGTIESNNCPGMYGVQQAAIVFTSSSSTQYTFSFQINSYGSDCSTPTGTNCYTCDTYYSTFAPTSSGITTSQSNGSYYTINSGTYTVQIFNLNSTGGADLTSPISNAQLYTFGPVTFSGSVPSQSITQNSS
jgi:hypothetical protein